MQVNLYSNTRTRPTMKDAMVRAEVGDERHGDDPTVYELSDRSGSRRRGAGDQTGHRALAKR
jgi:hypothetical protein